MITSSQITPGMTISIKDEIYRVESTVKVTVAKGVPFIKAKLKNLISDEVLEKNFKLDQEVNEVTMCEKTLEFLYLEGKDYLFLDVDNLEQVLVPASIIEDRVNFLKESIELIANCYGDTIFSVELPQFLELMVVKTEAIESKVSVSNASKIGVLETGAKVEVPLFIESGDIIKVDTHASEYVQRI
ncbi:MAG: Elongation factor P [Chlamydiia bacterium]|nr:Elongation factor P [Chlamydiia bacterium]MCH9615175.1 Elongation factor P [Chlamydiia bacterium]MCH9628503.1 Elongation factor P [Chlamydiia bacterium]